MKRDYLAKELGEDTLAAMRRVRLSFFVLPSQPMLIYLLVETSL